MKVTLKFFASIREAIGQGQEMRETGATTLAQLRSELLAVGAPYADSLGRDRAVRMAIDQVMSDESAPLIDGCEVAFFPPVTGG